MDKVISADGTPIAFERYGDGQPVILVGGAMCDRASHRPLAQRLADRFAAITYDRRGRGDSGDGPAYAVEREIEDLAALIEDAGEAAAVYGHSSGAALALHAAAHGLAITTLILHDPPFNPDDEGEQRDARQYAEDLSRLLADDRREDAVELFMTLVGMPSEAIEATRAEPWWPGMVALAPTLAYDSQAMDDRTRGGAVPTEELARIAMPAVVLVGDANPPWMVDIGRQMADGMASGRHVVLEGEGHAVAPEVLAPVLAGLLAH